MPGAGRTARQARRAPVATGTHETFRRTGLPGPCRCRMGERSATPQDRFASRRVSTGAGVRAERPERCRNRGKWPRSRHCRRVPASRPPGAALAPVPAGREWHREIPPVPGSTGPGRPMSAALQPASWGGHPRCRFHSPQPAGSAVARCNAERSPALSAGFRARCPRRVGVRRRSCAGHASCEERPRFSRSSSVERASLGRTVPEPSAFLRTSTSLLTRGRRPATDRQLR